MKKLAVFFIAAVLPVAAFCQSLPDPRFTTTWTNGGNIIANNAKLNFGAKGDGTTNDTAALNTCGAAGSCFLPSGNYKITAKVSGQFIGAGKSQVTINGLSISGAAVELTNGGSSPQAVGKTIGGFKLVGNLAGSSVGLNLIGQAYLTVSDVDVEGFVTGQLATDVDQSLFSRSIYKGNGTNVQFNASSCCTGPNTNTFVNVALGGATTGGLIMAAGTNFKMIGGSVQNNPGFGVFLNDVYSAAFHGVDFEGNQGTSIIFTNNGVPGTLTVDGGSIFNRGFASFNTNQILTTGTQPQTVMVSGNRFFSSGGYTPSASRPLFASTNTACGSLSCFVDNGSNLYADALEAPSWSPNTHLPTVLSGDITKPAGSTATTYANVVPAGKGGAGTVSGALKGNGSGTVSQAACADLSNAVASCSTDATNAGNITSGSLPTARLSLSPTTASLGADVTISTAGTYVDGPSVNMGTSGTFWVCGSVTVNDTAGAGNFMAKLWDGTTDPPINSGDTTTAAANWIGSISLCGIVTNPAGALRMSVTNSTRNGSKVLFNFTGRQRDSTISAFRLN